MYKRKDKLSWEFNTCRGLAMDTLLGFFFFLTILSIGRCAPVDDFNEEILDYESPAVGGKDVVDFNSQYQKEREIEELERERAAAAQYHFATNVEDGISDLTQHREEVRDGLKVKGFYSYSDGHFKRKVTYEADEKGYRIVRQDVEPLNGPKINPEGRASVRTRAHGNEVVYTVHGDDNVRRRRLYEKLLEEQRKELEAAEEVAISEEVLPEENDDIEDHSSEDPNV